MRQIVKFVETVGKKVIFKFTGIIPNLSKDDEYILEIKEISKDRSLEQNKYMWAIIQTIADMTGNDIWDIYIAGLRKLAIKTEFVMALPDAEERLKSAFRFVKKVEEREYNGKPMNVYQCFYGSSTFNTKEMTVLIDYFQGVYIDLVE